MQIEKVRFLSDYIIELELSNNQIIHFDLKPQLKTARFNHIISQQFFEMGTLVDHCYIHWDDVTEMQDYEMIGENFLRENAMK